MPTLENWNRSAKSMAQKEVAPTSATELQRIVKDSSYPSPLRAAGHRHSVNACFAADRGAQQGTQVHMRHFDHVRVDTESSPPTITVGAGVTLLQIREALKPHGLELALMPEIGNATAGSVACAGTKDSWLFPVPPSAQGWPSQDAAGIAQISSLVRSLRMVDAAGNDLLVSDPEQLHVLRSSYGLMGIIHEVTFEVRQAMILRSEYEWLTATPYAVPSLDAVFGGAHGVLAFLQPYSGRLLVERRYRDPDATIGPYDELKRGARDFMWEWGASEATTFAAGLGGFLNGPGVASALLSLLGGIPGVVNPFTRPIFEGIIAAIGEVPEPEPDIPLSSWLLRVFDASVVPFFNAVGGFRGYRGDSMIDFQFERPSYFDFTFWAFPVSRWEQIVKDYLVFCRQQAEGASPFESRLFTEIYFIGSDQHSLLSFSPEGPVFTLDMVDTYRRDDDARRAAWHRMSEAYNRWAARQGGRPVLNQTKQIDQTPGVVKPPTGLGVFGPAWPTFQEAVAKADPLGRFRNGFFDALL